jgi:hypothetical protein
LRIAVRDSRAERRWSKLKRWLSETASMES